MYKGGLRDKRDTSNHLRHHRRDLIIFKEASTVSPYWHVRCTRFARLFSLHRYALKFSRRSMGPGVIPLHTRVAPKKI